VEKTTRERLTGAVIFVALVAIVAPEMFSGRDDDAVVNEQAAPAEAGPPLTTYELPINPSAAPPAPREATPPAPAPESIAQATPPPAPADDRPPATTATRDPAPAPAPAQSTPAQAPTPATTASTTQPATGSWWVQLGSFSSEQNAHKLARDLRARGFSIEVARVKAGGADMHRVRAGPVKDRAAAADLKNRIGSSARDARLVGP
jgi:DedD protein